MAAGHHHHPQHQKKAVSMARISFSPLVVAASGSVADTVFAKWKGRPYIRSRVIPANPNTDKQAYQRQVMAAAVALYASLTDDLKTAWRTYGTAYSISGANAFSRKNAATAVPNGDATYPRLDVRTDLVPQFSPPDQITGNITDFAAVTGAGDAGDIDITWGASGWPALGTVYFWAMPDDAANNVIGQPELADAQESGGSEAVTLPGLDPAHTYIVIAVLKHGSLEVHANTLAVRGVSPKAA